MVAKRLCVALAMLMACTLPYTVMSAPGAAAKSKAAPERVCVEADLTGVFRMIRLVEKPKADEAAWFAKFPYHYLVFNTNHTYDYVASRRPLVTSNDLEEMIKKTTIGNLHKLERKYVLEDEGLLKLYIEDRLDYTYRCMFEAKATGDILEGDLLFVGYSKNNNELHKFFRHANLK